MSIPYQCIKRRGKALIAARGSCIEIFNPRDGSLLSSWKYPSAQDSKLGDSSSQRVSSILEKQNSESSIDIVLENSPPAKRRKLSITEEDSQVQQPNQGNGTKRAKKKILNKGNKRSNATRSGLENPAVIALEGTADGCHVVAIIGEDKSICVFRQEVDGGKNVLRKLSQRLVS
jgi:tRNA (guanine-N(7)-)-methyltransferase subunit TRM82